MHEQKAKSIMQTTAIRIRITHQFNIQVPGSKEKTLKGIYMKEYNYVREEK